MHRDVVILHERGDAIPGNRRQKLVEGFPVGRKRLVPANEILALRDDLHRPVFLAVGLAEDIDKHGDIVLGEFAGEFGMFEFWGIWVVDDRLYHLTYFMGIGVGPKVTADLCVEHNDG
jgi:hypothetical protein